MGSVIQSNLFRNTLAMQTDGIAQYAYIDNPTFKTDTVGAFSIWYRPTTVLGAVGAKGIIGYGSIDATTRHVFIEQRRNGNIGIPLPYRNQPCLSAAIRATGAPTGTITQYDHIFVAGALTHIVMQSDGTAYVNGVLVGGTTWFTPPATGAWLNSLVAANNRLCIGTNYTAGAPQNFGDQNQDEATYWNRPLTGTEVTKLYGGGTPINPHQMELGSVLKSWWRFGDSRDTAGIVYDEIGSNDLTMVGSPTYVTP